MLRKLICRLVFGADELAQRTLAIIAIRKAALKKHQQNKEVAATLEESRKEVTRLQDEYLTTKYALQKSFDLVLD